MAVSATDIVAARNLSWAFPVLLEVKETDVNKRKGILSAYATVYYKPGTQDPVIDDYQDWVSPGSFTKTIADLTHAAKSKNYPYLVKNLWQHNPNWITGGVVGISEDSAGVVYESKMAKGVRLADEVLELADQKMIGSSFGYFATRASRDTKTGIRTIKELALQEISQVVYPANEYAPIIGVKDGSIFPKIWALGGIDKTEAAILQEFTPPEDTSETKQLADFNSVWQSMQASEARHEYFMLEDALSQAIMAAARSGEGDVASHIQTCCNQFATAVQSWHKDFGDILSNASSDEVYGMMSADRSAIAVKALATWWEKKKGASLSAANRKRIEDAIEEVRKHMQGLEDFLAEHTQKPDAPPASDTPTGEEEEGKGADIRALFVPFWERNTQQTEDNATPTPSTPFARFPFAAPLAPDSKAVPLSDFLQLVRDGLRS